MIVSCRNQYDVMQDFHVWYKFQFIYNTISPIILLGEPSFLYSIYWHIMSNIRPVFNGLYSKNKLIHTRHRTKILRTCRNKFCCDNVCVCVCVWAMHVYVPYICLNNNYIFAFVLGGGSYLMAELNIWDKKQ